MISGITISPNGECCLNLHVFSETGPYPHEIHHEMHKWHHALKHWLDNVKFGRKSSQDSFCENQEITLFPCDPDDFPNCSEIVPFWSPEMDRGLNQPKFQLIAQKALLYLKQSIDELNELNKNN